MVFNLNFIITIIFDIFFIADNDIKFLVLLYNITRTDDDRTALMFAAMNENPIETTTNLLAHSDVKPYEADTLGYTDCNNEDCYEDRSIM